MIWRVGALFVAGAAALVACDAHEEHWSMPSPAVGSAAGQPNPSAEGPGLVEELGPRPDPCAGPIAAGEACGSVGLRCRLGFHVDPACNDEALCTTGMTWAIRRGALGCRTACPASFADVVPGAACEAIGTPCAYDEATCACALLRGDAGAPASPGPDGSVDAAVEGGGGDGAAAESDAGKGSDGGAVAFARAPGWQCSVTAPSCPPRPPPLGASCVVPVVCDYLSCVTGRQDVFECRAGAWRGAKKTCK